MLKASSKGVEAYEFLEWNASPLAASERRLLRKVSEHAAAHSLSVQQVQVLLFIKERGEACVKDAIEFLGLPHSSARNAVIGLVERELIAAPALGDGRSKRKRMLRYAPTKKGGNLASMLLKQF
jgi:DNA-binding MarR family transcriptional regulator